jgi:hypothetical protein
MSANLTRNNYIDESLVQIMKGLFRRNNPRANSLKIIISTENREKSVNNVENNVEKKLSDNV